MTEQDGLLVRLRTYRPSVDRDSREDFVTEVFGWLLDQSDSFGRFFLEKMSRTNGDRRFVVPTEKSGWDTQYDLGGGNRPDMVWLTDSLVLVFEHKVGAGLPSDQIQRYRNAAKEIFPNAEVVLVGITRSVVEHSGVADIPLTWMDVHEWISEFVQSPHSGDVPGFYFEEFQQLLTHEGLGPAAPLAIQAIRSYPQAKQFPDQLSGLLSSIQDEVGNAISGFKVKFLGMRSGRLGLQLVRDNKAYEWAPGIFIGCVLNGRDHGITERLDKEVLFQVILSFERTLHNQYDSMDAYRTLVDSLRQQHSENGWRVYHHLKEAGRGNLNKWHPLYLERPLLNLLEGKDGSEHQSRALLEAVRTAFDMLNANGCLDALVRECDAKLSTQADC